MVVVTLYVPAIAAVVAAMVGFWDEEAKLLGPVQLYVAEATVAVPKERKAPTQSGPLLVAAGIAGIGLMVVVVIPAGLGQPLAVATTE